MGIGEFTDNMEKIGLFLNNLDEWYQISIYENCKKEANKLGYDLVCVQGFSALDSDRYNFKGILLLTSVLITSKKSDIKALADFAPDIPKISLGNKLGSISSVLIDSKKSMGEMLDHLIVFHGYRQFLYLGGPKYQPDNIIRENFFKEAIKNYLNLGYEVSGEVLNGEFHETSGFMTLSSYILSNQDFDIDCIVCANDYIALGAQRAIFTHLGKDSVCPITGFDDIDGFDFLGNDLTTVKQPISELCNIGIRQLDSQIKGKNNILNSVVYTELIIKSSCGCRIKTKQDTNSILKESKLENIRINQFLRTVTFFGQNLASIENLDQLIFYLNGLLNVLNIDFFYLLLFKENSNNLEDMNLLYKKDGLNIETEFPSSVSSFSILNNHKDTVIGNLISDNQRFGIVIYNFNKILNPHLCACCVFISNGIRQLKNIEKEKRRSKELEEIVELRTRDILDLSNKLQKEAQRRLEVEAEVLKISEMERMRFSLDLHDDICQRLGGLAMFSKSINSQKELNELSVLIEDTLTRTRQYAHNSFPIDLKEVGLKNALEGLIYNLSKSNNIDFIFSWKLDLDFSSEEKINIFRIIQEALNNIVKHSRATKIILSGEGTRDSYSIRISDNGKGFKCGSVKQGLGLRSMEYRAHQIDVIFLIEPVINKGTSITLTRKIN